MRYLLACLALATLTLATAAIGATVTTPGPVTIVALDVSTVTTGGTAVTALAAGKKTAGGWLMNPTTATAPLCISELTTPTTTPSGSTTCIAAGTSYVLTPGNGPVLVNATDAGHVYSGQGAQQ